MCPAIARFANSSEDNRTHSVEMTTNWGGVFREGDGHEVIAEKTCKHDQYEPGKQLCDYLMENTSTQFATINFRRALSCLAEAQVYVGPPESQVEYLNGRITSFSVKGVKPDIEVSVEFSTGSDERAPSLKIGAERTGS